MNFRKLTDDLSTTFNRAVQLTEEKLGQADRTYYDEEFENLMRQADITQQVAERIIKCTEAVLQPNPAYRVEDVISERLEKDKRERNSPLEDLGVTLDAASAEITGNYGTSLRLTAQAEHRLARLEHEFIHTSNQVLLKPLRSFLNSDVPTVQKERKTLERLRLDLDSAKNRLKKSKESNRLAAESECKRAQAEFDQQLRATRLLLEGVASTHVQHAHCLNDFIEAQMHYHSECTDALNALKNELKDCVN